MLHTISFFTTQDNLIQYLLFDKVIFFALVLLLGCCWEGSFCFVLCICLYVLRLLCFM